MKPGTAILADERFLPGVSSLVVLQLRRLGERFPADITGQRPLFPVHSLEVKAQSLPNLTVELNHPRIKCEQHLSSWNKLPACHPTIGKFCRWWWHYVE